jgi:predicted aminopeptidase
MKRTAVLIIPLCFFPLFSGCYLLKQGTYLLSYNSHSRPIEKVLAEESKNSDVGVMLSMVQEIRRYAVEEIGLVDNRNYTRYLELDRDYLVDVVSACAADSFSPYQWWFPFFGSFPYKGFYEPEDAQREASRLQRKGLDVWVRQVDGFSTLGFFSDPIYSFMTEYPLFALAELIIHEQTHATVFVKNEIQFSEELATFVGREGALSFLRDRYGDDSEAYRQALASLSDWSRYRDRVIELYDVLDRLYRSGADSRRIRAAKQRIVEEFNQRLRSEATELFQSDPFRSFKGIPVNNAYILSFVRYSEDLDIFYRLYEARGGDLKKTVEVLKQIKQVKGPPNEYLQRLVP